jgi:hypothetical protein
MRSNVCRSWAHGRHAKGDAVACSKIPDSEVQTIRRLHREGATQKELAEKYGVSETAIRYTIRRRKP